MDSGFGVRKEALSPLGKKGSFSWKGPVNKALKVLLAILIIVLLSGGSQILYWRYAYGTFLVNGSSMYPTLNHEAEMWVDGGLSPIPPEDIGAFDGGEGTEYAADFGLMDDSEDFRDSLVRFSVVITYFDDDFQDGALLPGAAPKIKRIVGLPGETIEIDEAGSLFVDGVEVAQDFVPEWGEDYFQEHLHETGPVAPYELSEDEYLALLSGETEWMRSHPSNLVQELYWKQKHQQLRPRVLVSYVREPYIYAPGNVRVTFDSKIRTSLFRQNFLLGEVRDICATDSSGDVILEVKYDAFLPEIISCLLQTEGLRRQAFSKYGVCRRFG